MLIRGFYILNLEEEIYFPECQFHTGALLQAQHTTGFNSFTAFVLRDLEYHSAVVLRLDKLATFSF